MQDFKLRTQEHCFSSPKDLNTSEDGGATRRRRGHAPRRGPPTTAARRQRLNLSSAAEVDFSILRTSLTAFLRDNASPMYRARRGPLLQLRPLPLLICHFSSVKSQSLPGSGCPCIVSSTGQWLLAVTAIVATFLDPLRHLTDAPYVPVSSSIYLHGGKNWTVLRQETSEPMKDPTFPLGFKSDSSE
ncbi:hypothetical protein J6590_061329 [Homalodisca vitripennis]|nr:hypothetical protein J6590_061329 [Homalodisca vitripennis]